MDVRLKTVVNARTALIIQILGAKVHFTWAGDYSTYFSFFVHACVCVCVSICLSMIMAKYWPCFCKPWSPVIMKNVSLLGLAILCTWTIYEISKYLIYVHSSLIQVRVLMNFSALHYFCSRITGLGLVGKVMKYICG